ncbi:hypothetical protein CYMTET_29336 [Cymbomonas tetramitiformis]|uniref:Gamma-tubulin complex component n=1 Tax=Cymbomonas tetramitiformis TaxID=36881 RepID=A0AAE0FL15_9CHLO|nr:hypothetical protein CYMTET_29336 [Cymbomonas tetramitiformis]
MASREEQTAALLKRLVSCVVTSSKSSQSAEAVKIRQKAFRYAVRIIGSRIATGVVGDEGTVAEAIKRKLVQNRPADSFTFSELHRKLMSLPTYQQRYELLRLLSIISEDDQRTSTGNTSLGSTLLGAVTSGVLPKVSVDDIEGTAGLAATTDSFAHSRISVDGTSSAESTPQHRAAAATSFGSAGLAVVTAPPSGLAPHKAVAYQEMSEIERTDFEISEAALVRDVIYCCQGIDGHHVRYSIKDDGYVVDQHVGVPASARELLRKLCELGWLFRRVRSVLSTHPVLPGPESVVSSTASMAKTGSVAQAFGSAIQRELADYYRLMAVLEAQAHQGRPLPGKTVPGTGGQYLTLKRLVVWLAEPLQRMRLLAVLVDATHNRKGGGIAGALHQHTQHGDPFVHALTMRLTHQVCVPLFRMLSKWLFEGELQDTFGEFFVVADPSVEDKDLWYKKYCLSEQMLPPFISQELAGQILRTGKSINFMRLCCSDQVCPGLGSAAAIRCARGSARLQRSGVPGARLGCSDQVCPGLGSAAAIRCARGSALLQRSGVPGARLCCSDQVCPGLGSAAAISDQVCPGLGSAAAIRCARGSALLQRSGVPGARLCCSDQVCPGLGSAAAISDQVCPGLGPAAAIRCARGSALLQRSGVPGARLGCSDSVCLGLGSAAAIQGVPSSAWLQLGQVPGPRLAAAISEIRIAWARLGCSDQVCPGLGSAAAISDQVCPGLGSAAAISDQVCPGLGSAAAISDQVCPGLGSAAAIRCAWGSALLQRSGVPGARLGCSDQGWAEASAAAVAGVSARGGLAYGQGSALESAVSEAARRIDERLMEILFKRFRFADHCVAIKRYLLLGQGDFIQSLLDLAGPDLNARAHLISAYKMTGALEGAVRSSNAQFDELAQTHLRVRRLQWGAGNSNGGAVKMLGILKQ